VETESLIQEKPVMTVILLLQMVVLTLVLLLQAMIVLLQTSHVFWFKFVATQRWKVQRLVMTGTQQEAMVVVQAVS